MARNFLIVGGGVIGLSIARALHKRNIGRITLVDKGACGQESSWAAGGMLGPQAEADTAGEFFDLCSLSRDSYPAFSAELLSETGVDIELDRSGTLYLAFTKDDVRHLRDRFEWQRSAGLDVEHLSAETVRKSEPFVSPDVREGLYFPSDWQVDNRKLLTALLSYCNLNSIEVIENTAVERLIVENGRVTGAEADGRRFEADETIIATGAWTSLIELGAAQIPIRIEPVRGQMVMLRTARRLFERVIYSRRGYLVPRADGRLLAGSTTEKAGFDKVATEAAAGVLRKMVNEIAPSTAGLPIADHWSGLRPFAVDGLPVIGRIDGISGAYFATAHYRNGILLAPLTARMVADDMTGREVLPNAGSFAPGRFKLRAVRSHG